MGPMSFTFRAQGGLLETSRLRDPAGPVLGGHMDTNRMFTNLFGGWLTAADKAAAATINFTRSTVRARRISRPDSESNAGNRQGPGQSRH